MRVIQLSKKKFETLSPLILPDEVISTEGILYHYRYTSLYDGVLKKLNRIDGNLFANKLYTIELLNYYKVVLPNNFVIPDYLITIKGEIVGFCMAKVYGDNLGTILKNHRIDYKDKIYYLKVIGDILDKLDNIRKYTDLKDIFIGDLQECNFMVNPYSRDVYVIDLDSCKISDNLASPGRYLIKGALLDNVCYKYNINKEKSALAYVIPNRNSDLYCYNIMVLNYLYGSNMNGVSLLEFCDYLNYLEYIGVDRELLDKIYSLVGYGDNFNIGGYLDSLTYENIMRANYRVYRKVRNK